MVTSGEISRAKQKAVGGKKDRCLKGKSCSATCISGWKACLVEMSSAVSSSLSRVKNLVSKQAEKVVPGMRGKYLKRRGAEYTKVRGKLLSQIDRAKYLGDGVRLKELEKKLKRLEGGIGSKLKVPESTPIDSEREGRFKARAERYKKAVGNIVAKMESAASGDDEPTYRNLENALMSIQSKAGKKFKGMVDTYEKGQIWKGGEESRKRRAKAISNIENTIRVVNGSGFSNVRDFEGVVKPKDVNWKAGLEPGAKYVASGVNGSFVEVPPENLAKGLKGMFPGGVGVKYGRVEASEVELLKKAGDSGAAPKLIAAKVSKSLLEQGMVAMERVPGDTLRNLSYTGKIDFSSLSDKYIEGISKLHKMGIAHNDAHLGNAILQPNGKIKFIDLGYASLDPRWVIREIMQVMFTNRPVFTEYPLTGAVANKVRDNYARVRSEVHDFEANTKGKDKKQIDEEAMALINKIYDGI